MYAYKAWPLSVSLFRMSPVSIMRLSYWDGGGATQFQLFFTTTTDISASIGWFQEDIPHVEITAFTDVGAGNVEVDYTLHDQASASCEIAMLFSVDGGGHFAVCSNPGPGPVGNHDGTDNLASTPAGTAHKFVWYAATDGVAEGQDFNVKGTARVT